MQITKYIIILSLFFIHSIKVGAQEKSNWDYKKYAEILDKNGNDIFVLEYGISKKGYSGSIKWRISNNTSATIYEFRLGKRTYTLLDGKQKTSSAESPFTGIKPGEKKTMVSDAINPSEGKGWSNLVDNYVVNIEFQESALSFTIEKGKEKKDWVDFGKLKTYKVKK